MQANGCVLAATDFSDGASAALEEARRLADRAHAQVRLIHVAEGYRAGGWSADGAALEWLLAAGVGTESLLVRMGLPWVEVVRCAEDLQPLMIVVGSHGSSGFQPVALGSTAMRLSLLSPYPVLVVGQRSSRPRGSVPLHRQRL